MRLPVRCILVECHFVPAAIVATSLVLVGRFSWPVRLARRWTALLISWGMRGSKPAPFSVLVTATSHCTAHSQTEPSGHAAAPGPGLGTASPLFADAFRCCWHVKIGGMNGVMSAACLLHLLSSYDLLCSASFRQGRGEHLPAPYDFCPLPASGQLGPVLHHVLLT